MSRSEFRGKVKEIAMEQDEMETTFRVDGLPTDKDTEWVISSFGIENMFIDDTVVEREASKFRSMLESMDVETFEFESDSSNHWFGIRFPDVKLPEFESFRDDVEHIVDEKSGDTFLSVTDVTNTESVRITGSWDGYERSGRAVENDCQRVVESLETEGYNVSGGEPAQSMGFVSMTVHFDSE